MSEQRNDTGSCFCGAVQVRVSGEPVAMGYCHCDSCRQWSAAPVNAFMLWKSEAVEVVSGAEHLRSYQKTPKSIRKWCSLCGGHLLTEHPGMGLIDVYAAITPGVRFTPGMHVFYTESVLAMRDGLPKFRDLPEAAGGSGEQMPE